MERERGLTILQLVILTSNGEYVTDWGKSAITKNSDHCIGEWKHKKHGTLLPHSPHPATPHSPVLIIFVGVSWLQLLKLF